MDKGARFYKCDFQVHTPRDIQWTGRKFGVQTELTAGLTQDQKNDIDASRAQFAKEYLERIRQHGLNSIAITDHHDVQFAKVIREVARYENLQFVQDNELDKCVTVFPGIELTLVNPNCQCILVFDSDFPDHYLDSVLGMFGITPSDPYDKDTAPVIRIPMEHVNDLKHLYKRLDETAICKERFILLPNLGNSGQSTLLRAGAHDHYIKMPCAGGYVDKALPNDTGWANKTDGGDVNYGNRSVGILSTSDNRCEDGRELGRYFTFIKWAEPSAEALRQACLAKQSRISQNEPEIPQIAINKLDVTNSRFLGSFVIEFNKQYNALIGGRGTGKSTILEYLRWGLCDQISTADIDDFSEIDKRRKKLIDKTLSEFEGEVRITFTLNGIVHVIKRSSVTKETSLKIDNSDFQRVTEEEIRKLLPIQAYSQKQLSSVGVSTEELKRFIQIPIANALGSFDLALADVVKSTRTEYLNVRRKREVEIENDQFNLEILSLTNQVNSLRQSLNGMSENDQNTIARKSTYDNESNIISNLKKEQDSLNQKVIEFNTSLSVYPYSVDLTGASENSDLISRIDEKRIQKVEVLKNMTSEIIAILNGEQDREFRELINVWEVAETTFQGEYEIAKSKSTSNSQQLKEIERIEVRLSMLKNSFNDRQLKLRELGEPEATFNNARSNYWQIHRDKASLLKAEADKFSNLSHGLIKVEVERKIDMYLIKSELTKVLQGARINNEKLQSIIEGIAAQESPLADWEIVLNEFRQLAELDNKSTVSHNNLPHTPKLIEYGLNENNIRKITEVLNTENWLNLATLKLEFTPIFKYTTNVEMNDSIAFSEASAGQQATALLTVLLNQSGPPLLIDQPEDDIDNRAIDQIIKNIWSAKKRRQLIFTSHNANLVVNGDSELVICCDYRESGSQTRGIIKTEGAIDSKTVKLEITSVMEGGEKSFKLRKEKYGF